MEKTLTEIIANYVSNPKKEEINRLKEKGLPIYLLTKTLSSPLKVGEEIAKLSFVIGISALVGEGMDYIPYINTSIPEVMNNITNSDYFSGNLDKFGAVLGYINYYLKKD